MHHIKRCDATLYYFFFTASGSKEIYF